MWSDDFARKMRFDRSERDEGSEFDPTRPHPYFEQVFLMMADFVFRNGDHQGRAGAGGLIEG